MNRYKIDGTLFIENPIQKQWLRQNVAVSTKGNPIAGSYWTLGLSFSTLSAGSGTASEQFMTKYLEGGLHSAELPHPVDGQLTIFSGVAIEQVSFSFSEVDRDKWVDSCFVQLGHISLGLSWLKLIANFYPSAFSGDSPLEIQFTNTSIGTYTSCLWDFGDGTTSIQTNPVKTYTVYENTPFVVSLTITDGTQVSIYSMTINVSGQPGEPG